MAISDINSLLSQLSIDKTPEPVSHGYMNFHIPGNGQLTALNNVNESIRSLNSGFKSKFYNFFDVLNQEENLLFPQSILSHFDTLKELNPKFYEFIYWKLSLEYACGILDFLDGIKTDYELPNFLNRLVCIAQDTGSQTKLIIFELKYKAGYFLESEQVEKFICLDEQGKFENITGEFDFVDTDNGSCIQTVLSEYWDENEPSMPKYVDYWDATEGIQNKSNEIAARTIQIETNLISALNDLPSLKFYKKGNHRLKVNGCLGGFYFEMSIRVENAGKEFVLKKDAEIDSIAVELPYYAVVNQTIRVKLTNNQSFLLFLFLQWYDRSEFIGFKDIIDDANKNSTEDIAEKSEKAIEGLFRRIKESFEKEGIKNLVEIQGASVCIHKKAD